MATLGGSDIGPGRIPACHRDPLAQGLDHEAGRAGDELVRLGVVRLVSPSVAEALSRVDTATDSNLDHVEFRSAVPEPPPPTRSEQYREQTRAKRRRAT